MSEETKQIRFVEQDPEVIFTDVVQINVIEDTVSISLGVKSTDGETAQVKHKLYMSFGHFLKLAKTSNDLVNKIRKDFEKTNNQKD